MLAVTQLMFVNPGVKIDTAYYRYFLLSHQLLPVIRQISGNFSFFSRTVLWHTEHVTPSVSWNVTRLHSFRQISGRRIAQTVIPSTTWSGTLCSTEYTKLIWRIWTIWSAVWLTCGLVYSRAFSTTPSTSDVNVSALVFEPEMDTSNIRSDSRISQTLWTLIHSINISF